MSKNYVRVDGKNLYGFIREINGRETMVFAENEDQANEKLAAMIHYDNVNEQMRRVAQAIESSNDEKVTEILERAYNEMLNYIVTI